MDTSDEQPVWLNEDYCADPDAMWSSIHQGFHERRASHNHRPPAVTLQALRVSCHCSQEQLAQALDLKQTAVSRIERRADMYVSTLAAYIQALGGSLELVARLPAREVYLTL